MSDSKRIGHLVAVCGKRQNSFERVRRGEWNGGTPCFRAPDNTRVKSFCQ